MVNHYAQQTRDRIARYRACGWDIIEGNNPRLPKTKRWSGYECVRLCLTNSKRHGWPIRTVWAVRPPVVMA